MKKAYITNENATGTFALYVGIDALHGGWLLETGGDPTTLNELEEAQAEADIAAINNVIADPDTPWEELKKENLEYVREWLEIWG